MAQSPYKICFFCSVSTLETGMPISTIKLIEHFGRNPAYSVTAVFPAEGSCTRRLRELPITIKILRFWRLRSIKHPAHLLRFCLTYPIVFLRIALFFRRLKPDIVHFSDAIDAPFYPVAKMTGSYVLAHLRQAVPWPVAYRLWCMVLVNRVICISYFVKNYAGFTWSRARVIYNPGPDRELFQNNRNGPPPPCIKRDRINIVAVGKFFRAKGYENLLRIAAITEQHIPECLHFIIVGGVISGHQGYFNEIKNLHCTLALQKIVTFAGQMPHSQLPEVLAHCEIAVHFPNYFEGLGGVVLEAMRMSLPVVAFRSGGVEECIVHRETGFLVSQGDLDSAAEFVEALACDERLRAKMGQAGKRFLEERFSWKNHFEGIEEVYREVLKDGRR